MNLSFKSPPSCAAQHRPASQSKRLLPLRFWAVAIFLLNLFTTVAQAQTLETRAQAAALADGATTLGALAMGAAEANPLGLAALVLKLPMLAYIGTLREEERASAYAMQASIWGAAAANNLCVMAAIATAGTFAPACIVAAAVWGYREWTASADEREFWDICGEWHATRAELKCVYINPQRRTEIAAMSR